MKVFVAVGLALMSMHALAFTYFDNQIDYWHPSKVEQSPAPQQPRPNPPPAAEAKSEFDWRKYSDPKNKDFFREGDYTPPEPFMELVRNPTDENIKQWFALVDAKNQMMGALHKRLAEYAAKNQPPLTSEESDLLSKKQAATAPSEANVKRFRFRLYFDSKCQHCKNMMSTFKELQDLGYYVEVKQVDNLKPEFPIPFPVSQATPEELKEKSINAWPVTFVADVEKKVSYRLNGYLPTATVLAIVSRK